MDEENHINIQEIHNQLTKIILENRQNFIQYNRDSSQELSQLQENLQQHFDDDKLKKRMEKVEIEIKKLQKKIS